MWFKVIILISCLVVAAQSVCQLDTTTLGDSEPLFLSKVDNEYEFKIPVSGILRFAQNEKFVLACTTNPYGNF